MSDKDQITNDITTKQNAEDEEADQNEDSIPREDSFEESMKIFRELLMKENLNIVAKMRQYKQKDFRRKVFVDQMNELKKLSELSKAWVTVPFVKRKFYRQPIEVDTSKAGSNIDVVRLAITDLGWKEYPSGRGSRSCHIVWNGCSYNENKNILGAYVNKYPGIGLCLHKVSFTRILETMRQLFPEHYSFYPPTWFLPHQLTEFSMYVKNKNSNNSKQKNYYIVKPDAGTQGDGIYLITGPQEYRVSAKNHVVQEYLAEPLLIDGYKFDLRVYAVMVGFDPPEVYLCGEGLARFCTQRYSNPNVANYRYSYMHLTNYSLNKRSNNFDHSQNVDTGSKRTMTSVFAYLESRGVNVTKVWRGIEEMVYKTVLAIMPHLKVHYVAEMLSGNTGPDNKPNNVFNRCYLDENERPGCFQILGFDVLLMDNLKPLLLEVNSNPSLRMDSEIEIAPGISEYYICKVDVKVKKPLVLDTLKLLERRICEVYCLQPYKDEEQADDCKKEEVPTTTTKDVEYTKSDQEDNCDSDKENLREIRRRWSADSEFGPHFVEIAKRNASEYVQSTAFNKEANGESSTTNDQEFPKENQVIIKPESEIQMTVSGTSPSIRKKQEQRELNRLAKEKSWVKSIQENENEQSHKSSISEVEEEASSCLNIISTKTYQSIFDKLRLLEETAVIFFHAIGNRGGSMMGATAFRTFSRNCRMHTLGFNHAMIDLIYVEVERRWSLLSKYDSSQGLCYQAFLEAFFRLAFARYSEIPKRSAVQNLIDHCKKSMSTDLWDWTRVLRRNKDPRIIRERRYGVNRPRNKQTPVTKTAAVSTQQKKKDDNDRPNTSTGDSREGSYMDIPINAPEIKIKSKYELMKAIRELYSKKWRSLQTKSNNSNSQQQQQQSAVKDSSSNSDTESVKSLPPLSKKGGSGSGSGNNSRGVNESTINSERNNSKMLSSSNNKNTDRNSTSQIQTSQKSYNYTLPNDNNSNNNNKKKFPNLAPYESNENLWSRYKVLPNPYGSSKDSSNERVTHPKSLSKSYDIYTYIDREVSKGVVTEANAQKLKQLAAIYGINAGKRSVRSRRISDISKKN